MAGVSVGCSSSLSVHVWFGFEFAGVVDTTERVHTAAVIRFALGLDEQRFHFGIGFVAPSPAISDRSFSDKPIVESIASATVEEHKLKPSGLPFLQLRDWVDLSLNYSVPSSLLILSRAFTVSGKVKPEEAVQATLSSLADEVVDTVGVTALTLPSATFQLPVKKAPSPVSDESASSTDASV
ncbi:Mitochondrial proton/calcium exchanger protein [Camellia lanceoleosa]|uniref:Mitochondrial proton/calcium exchanger protein n=1 Tax=Camellia lanceoleosa TaxID=1840588 RepID=A0ACC0G9T7_9ERIC|nr:Mitochondrial proton/calcium exchanger protein [Camellia lanceoleosa]